MINEIGTVLSLALDKIASVPAGWWFVVGLCIASIPATILVVAKVKARHFKKNAEKLASHFIVLNVAFWGFLLSSADFVVAHAANVLPLGTLFPFISRVWPVVSLAAIVTHAVATAMYQWWKDRQAGKKLTVPSIDPATVTSIEEQAASALGPVQPRPTQSDPSTNLFL